MTSPTIRFVRKKLESVYGSGRKGVEDLDLLIGTLAEAQRPKGFGFGETVFSDLHPERQPPAAGRSFLHRLLQRGRLHRGRALRWIDQTDLKTVILRHYPELADTGLANIKNAFEPWGRRSPS